MKTLTFISDQEINLDQSDFLKTKVYADNLVHIIKSTAKDNVFTIGLYGSWGSGKSSIIETAKQNFNKEKNNVKFVTYDAWQYSNDSFRRMFLRTLTKELNYKETDFMKRFYENESRDVDNEFKLSYTKSIYTLIGLLVILVALSFFKFNIEHKITTFSIITVLGTLVALFSGVFHQLKISVTKPFVFAPEQFEDCFKEIATKALKKNTIINKLKYFNDCDNTIKGLDKLVIVIDNIDRCNSEIAYQLLTDIKTFLGNQKFSIVFVIPVDDKALLKNFFSKETNSIQFNDKEEFLRKIFNVTLRIKPYNSTDMFAFTKNICTHNNLNFKNETVNIIGKEYSSNPRRVIQLLNNLIVELNNYGGQFAEVNETIICCILIIREEYPKFYDLVYQNASLLTTYPNTDLGKEFEDIHRFMRIADNEFRETKIGVLNKILMNSDNRFKNIPTEIIDMIDTFDSDGFVKILHENDSIDEEVYTYLCHKIDEAHDNGLKNDLSKYIGFVGLFVKEHTIPNPYLFKIFEQFYSKIEQIFYNSESPNILFELLQHAHVNFPKYQLKSRIIDIIRSRINLTDIKEQEKWLGILNSMIIVLEDEQTLTAIKEDYNEKYSHLLKVNELSDNQFKTLVTKEFIKRRINQITQLNETTREYIELKEILNRYENKEFVVDVFFEKIASEKIVSKDMDGRYLNIVLLNDFIKTAKESINNYSSTHLGTTIKLVFDELIMNKSNEYDLILALKTDNERIDFLLEFVVEYALFTGRIDLVQEYILNMDQYIPVKVRIKILFLLNNGVDVQFYYSNLYQKIDLYDQHFIALIKHYLTLQKDDFHIIQNSKNTAVVENLFFVIEENTKEVNEIFDYLLTTDSSEKLLIDYLNQKVKENEFRLLKYLSNELKKILSVNITSILINVDFIVFFLPLDDEVFNSKIIEKLDNQNLHITNFSGFVQNLMPYLANNNSQLKKLLIDSIDRKYINLYSNQRNNTHTKNTLETHINSIRAMLDNK